MASYSDSHYAQAKVQESMLESDSSKVTYSDSSYAQAKVQESVLEWNSSMASYSGLH